MTSIDTIGSMFTKALPWISAGLGLLSTVKAYQGANAVEKEGRFNAQVFRDEAAATWRSYEDNAAILRDEQRRFTATQTANYAKSGVALTGTPVEVLNDIVYRQSLDQTALYHAAVAGRAKQEASASLAQWQAGNQADAIRTGALTNFGSTLINSTGRALYGYASDRAVDPTVPRKYSTAQANAVPGGAGWRPISAAR